jgi:subtilisin family serine protease
MTPPTTDTAPSENSGCLTSLLFAGAVLWVLLVCIIVQGGGWFADQILMIEGLPVLGGWWVAVGLGQAVLLLPPLLLLWRFTHAPRLRAAYQAWTVASLIIIAFGLMRVFPIPSTQWVALSQVILTALIVLALALILRARGRAPSGRVTGVAAALLAVPLVVFPLLLWGSLGSLLDVLLDLLSSLAFGLLAGLLLDALLMRPLADQPTTPWRDLGFTALAAGLTLAILGSGFGFDGSQLLLLLVLPPLGLAAAAIGLRARRQACAAWPALALLIGLVTAGFALFVDPAELVLVLGGDEILTWAVRAAGLSLLLALLAGVILTFVLGVTRRAPAAEGAQPAGPVIAGAAPAPRLLGFAVAAILWLAGLVLYVFAGQPGLHGDWLFVVMRDQADVSSAAAMPDREARLAFVYHTLVQQADTSQAGLRAALDQLHVTYHPYYLVNGLEVNGGLVLRAFLATRPEVDRVLDSPHLRPLPAPPAPMTGDLPPPRAPEWNITSIGADRVWNELHVTGEGIVVGQSDSGVQLGHPALHDGYRGLTGGNDYNWLDPWNHTTEPTDAGGHGTHTLGTAVGRGGIGVAPGAQWMACVNLARNLGDPPLYLNCMQFMLAPWPQAGDPLRDGDPARAADVINNSWGCPTLEGCDAQVMGPAVAALRAAGIFVVASAGNEGPFCGSIREPISLYPEAFSVGAVDESGQLSTFSSRGPVTIDGSNRVKPDISAPGVDVLSSLPFNAYGTESGTSMAGPHVVGTVALMWSANPKLIGNIDQTEKILVDTAKPYTGTPDSQGNCPGGQSLSNEVGHGLLDAYAAVSEALKEK